MTKKPIQTKKSVQGRVSAWREKKSRGGGKALYTWMEPETAKQLEFLKAHYEESTALIITRAIKLLYARTAP